MRIKDIDWEKAAKNDPAIFNVDTAAAVVSYVCHWQLQIKEKGFYVSQCGQVRAFQKHPKLENFHHCPTCGKAIEYLEPYEIKLNANKEPENEKKTKGPVSEVLDRMAALMPVPAGQGLRISQENN